MLEEEVCPFCNREIKKESNFCKYCGTSLKICPECKFLNKAEDLFCGKCGMDLKHIESPQPLTKPKPILSRQQQYEIDQDITDVMQPKRQQPTSYLPFTSRQYRHQPVEYEYPTEKEEAFQPAQIRYSYSKVRALGFLGGPLPTSNVFAVTIEAFGFALAFIAVGITIAGIGLTFFSTLILPIIGAMLGGTFVVSAPFFGIYYVSSKWLYNTFEIKRPVRMSTIFWNYSLGTLLFSIIGIMLAPLFSEGGAVAISLAVVGVIVILMGLIIIPLKAFLADLIYVKASINERDKDKNDGKDETDEIEAKKK